MALTSTALNKLQQAIEQADPTTIDGVQILALSASAVKNLDGGTSFGSVVAEAENAQKLNGKTLDEILATEKIAKAENALKLGGKQATDFTLLNGNSEQRFKVADAVNDDEAVSKRQLDTAVVSGGGSGIILQVVRKDLNTSIATTQDAGVYILSDLTVRITAKADNSRFLIMAELAWIAENPNFGVGLYKDGALLFDNSDNGNYGNGSHTYDNSQQAKIDWEMNRTVISGMVTESIEKNTSIDFAIGLNLVTNDTTIYINRAVKSDSARAISNITVFEIGA